MEINSAPALEIEKETGDRNLYFASYIILILLFLLFLLPHLFKSARMWGFNHLIFLPFVFTIIYLILAVVALALPLFSFGRKWNDRILHALAHSFFDSPRKYLDRLLFVIIAAALFIIFPTPTHFLGDGYTVLGNLASHTGTFYKWTEKGITFILSLVQSTYGTKNEHSSLAAFRTVSVFSGICTIWFFFLIADTLTDHRIRKVITFTVLLMSGILLLFFGYVESYPLIWTGLSGFAYFSLRYIRLGRGFIAALIFLLFGLFIHLEMAVFIPAFLYLPFSRGRGLEFYKKYELALNISAILIIIAVLALFLWKFTTDIAFENIFLSPFGTKPGWPGYGVFTLPHMIDIFNHLILLSPAFVLLIYWALGRKSDQPLNGVIFSFLIAMGGLGFLLIIDPTLGLPRDWDLFSIAAIGLTLFLISLIPFSKISTIGKFYLPLLIYLFSATAPYLLVYLTESGSLNRTKYLIDLDRERALGAMVLLGKYYRSHENMYEVDSLNTAFSTNMINEAKIVKANNSLDRGDFKTARELLKTIRPDRLSAWYHGLMASMNYYDKDYDKALEESNLAIRLNNYNVVLYYTRATIFWAMQKPDSALSSLRFGYALNDQNSKVLEGLTGLFLFLNHPDSTIYYGERLIGFDSTYSIGYYFLTKAYLQTGQLSRARNSFDNYSHWGRNDPDFAVRKRELEQLLSSPPDPSK